MSGSTEKKQKVWIWANGITASNTSRFLSTASELTGFKGPQVLFFERSFTAEYSGKLRGRFGGGFDANFNFGEIKAQATDVLNSMVQDSSTNADTSTEDNRHGSASSGSSGSAETANFSTDSVEGFQNALVEALSENGLLEEALGIDNLDTPTQSELDEAVAGLDSAGLDEVLDALNGLPSGTELEQQSYLIALAAALTEAGYDEAASQDRANFYFSMLIP